MSNTFYNYISEKIITYFKTNEPNPGDKFFVQFETEDQVDKLYKELKNNIIAKSFIYEDTIRKQKYESYELKFGVVELIVAAAMGNIHPDFLATLRNLVGVAQGYENKAILFIHCSSLDSILGGAGSLGKEGMPLNILAIEKDIKRKINETGYNELDKTILTQYLENKSKELDGTIATIFEYEDIIQCLSDSQIASDEYKKFELFPDNTLSFFSGKQLKNRLAENHRNYIRVSEIHSYGADFSKLETIYGEDGEKVLSKPDWENTRYTEVEKYISNKINKASIEYNPIISNPTIWDKEEGTTKAKSRIRNILVFIDNIQEQVEFSLSFTTFTKTVGIHVLKAFESFVSVTSSGKKLVVRISDIEDKTVFGRFQYTAEGTRFEFKVAVLRCDPTIFEKIKTQYLLEIKGNGHSAIRINSEDDEIIINDYGENEKNVYVSEENQIISLTSDERLAITVSEDYPYPEENEDVYFTLSTTCFVVPFIKAFAVEKPTVIEGLKLWYLKRIKKSNFQIQGENGLILGTKRYCTRTEFRRSLDIEKKYIELGVPFAVKNGLNEELMKVDIKLPSEVRSAFDVIIDYFKQKCEIPSLVYIDNDIEKLYKEYLDRVIEEINQIGEGTYLTEEQKGLFCLGIIENNYGDKEILISPLHPINIAYQLFMNTQDITGIEDDEKDLLRRFQQTALLPYINIDPLTREPKNYMPVEQNYSPEWKTYVKEDLPRYKGSKDFVSKLVADKIQEFVEHFSYLFSSEIKTPIKINLINTGDCKEIVQGIVKYYVHELNTSKTKRVIPIQVIMYAESKMDNAFEIMSQIDDAETLIKALGIQVKVEKMNDDEVIDIYREHVGFYYRNLNDPFEYAHITFMELDDEHQAITTEMRDIPSGVVMEGIASGVPSEMLGDSYRTGFGTKYANLNSSLMQISVNYNSLNAAMNGDTYRKGSCYTLKMGISKQNILERIYEASNWVTFINPKVDLNYFKSDPSAKDLLIIHYSDQYNLTSSGYDAITVTKKSKQYQNTISRYLEKNGVENVQIHSKKIINMFNALNGDWLLRMLSYKSHFPVEKLSILSAMKLSVKRYSLEDIIWVPISLEEILRVSGSVGLSQSGSIFSARNLGFDGKTSDDLLLVGILNGENVKVTFYPIEVKIGKVESDYLEKGIKQALRTRQIFDEIIQEGPCRGKNIKTRLYRNFFMQQVLVNAEKMMLYEVGEDMSGWELVVRSDLRRKLLNEEYEVIDVLIPEMGKAGVISFREDCVVEREIRNQEVLIVEKTKKDGVNLLATEMNEIETVDWQRVKEVENVSEIAISVESIEKQDNDDSVDVEESKENNIEIIQDNLIISDRLENKDIRILIGTDKYNHQVFWEYGNRALANRHLLITGTSGQGKTYSIQTMLFELSKHKVSSVIFDYTESFVLQQLEQPFKDSLGDKINQHIVYSTGVPINPFQRQQVELAGQVILEKESDVAARLADIFAHVYNLGDQQYSAIFDAVYNGLKKYGDKMNMKLFQDELNEMVDQNKSTKSVISKMSPFFHTVDFSTDPTFNWGNILYADEAKVNIVQLTMFSQEIKVIITEMMLWDAWYYTKKYGTKDKPFVVVLDEAQNLSHTIKSPSAAILTEGRKFGWSAWFATQSLGILKSDEIVRLLQASFKLYFKPTTNEIVKIAKQLDVTGEVDWVPEVQKLKKGQCVVVGDKMKPNGIVEPAAPVVTSVASFDEREVNF